MAHKCNLCFISTKISNIFVNPLNSHQLIFHSHISGILWRAERHETKRFQSIIERYKDYTMLNKKIWPADRIIAWICYKRSANNMQHCRECCCAICNWARQTNKPILTHLIWFAFDHYLEHKYSWRGSFHPFFLLFDNLALRANMMRHIQMHPSRPNATSSLVALEPNNICIKLAITILF